MDHPLHSNSFSSRTTLVVPRSWGVVQSVGVSSRAVVVVDVNRGLTGQLSRVEYSTGIFPTAAVDPVAVKAVQGPGQRKHDRTLRLKLDDNPRVAPFESVAVLNESGQGENMAAEVWHVRNISQQHLHENVSGPKHKVHITVSLDRAG